MPMVFKKIGPVLCLNLFEACLMKIFMRLLNTPNLGTGSSTYGLVIIIHCYSIHRRLLTESNFRSQNFGGIRQKQELLTPAFLLGKMSTSDWELY